MAMAEEELQYDQAGEEEEEVIEPLPPAPETIPDVEMWKAPADLTPEERERLMKQKTEKEAAYFAHMQKWAKVVLYCMFFPTFLSIITIIAGVWCVHS